MYLVNCFFVYSILGYVLEMIFGFAIGASSPESGVLYGPWTPIYGIASVFIIVISNRLFKNLHLPRWIETIIVILVLMVVLSALEWLGGVLIELIFGFSFWDYSDSKFNLGKYVCLEFALIWSVLSLIFIYAVNPLLEKYIKKLPIWVAIILGMLFVLDLVIRVLVEFNIF